MLLAFDMADHQVVSERNIVAEGKKPADCYAAAGNGKLLALSKQHKSLLVIDAASARIEKAFALPAELVDPHSLCIAEGRLLVIERTEGCGTVCELSMSAI